jgi:hypothetical protein
LNELLGLRTAGLCEHRTEEILLPLESVNAKHEQTDANAKAQARIEITMDSGENDYRNCQSGHTDDNLCLTFPSRLLHFIELP